MEIKFLDDVKKLSKKKWFIFGVVVVAGIALYMYSKNSQQETEYYDSEPVVEKDIPYSDISSIGNVENLPQNPVQNPVMDNAIMESLVGIQNQLKDIQNEYNEQRYISNDQNLYQDESIPVISTNALAVQTSAGTAYISKNPVSVTPASLPVVKTRPVGSERVVNGQVWRKGADGKEYYVRQANFGKSSTKTSVKHQSKNNSKTVAIKTGSSSKTKTVATRPVGSERVVNGQVWRKGADGKEYYVRQVTGQAKDTGYALRAKNTLSVPSYPAKGPVVKTPAIPSHSSKKIKAIPSH